jgi:cytochrome c biogenesis protein CcdA
VVGAGLLDGVNPCAFATMVFLISYLSVRKRAGRELLATGAAFTVGVFIAYLGVGLGLLRFLTALPILTTVSRWIYGLTLVLCLALAWGSFADYRKARRGQLEDMSLKLPERLRGWIRHLIREGSRARNYVLASLALGFAVSVVELACTGQVYLPTIVFVLGLPEWRARAAVALLVYNVMFIVPLMVIFLLAYYGTTSKQLSEWMSRHAASVKLGTAALFLLMAGWLGYSLFLA